VKARSALVTGANRGLGLQVSRQLVSLGYDVIMTGRDADAIEASAAAAAGTARVLDVTDPASVARLVESLESEGVRLDVLVNNAGVYFTTDPLAIDEYEFAIQMAANAFGPWLLMRAFVPWMVERGYGRVVNVTSVLGSFSAGLGGGSHGVSKSTLNALTVTIAAEIPASVDVAINAVDPGWVRTDMGGPDAPGSVQDAAADIVWAAALPAPAASGQCFHHRHPVPW
jgi:NAD(P)-dependent dehydrogenase (short-subunit alcohol dehydrogenase family)